MLAFMISYVLWMLLSFISSITRYVLWLINLIIFFVSSFRIYMLIFALLFRLKIGKEGTSNYKIIV